MADWKQKRRDDDFFDDEPLEMPTRFSATTAADLGLHEAIVLADFLWRIKIRSGVQRTGDVECVRYTAADIARIFPYWTPGEFTNTVRSLVDQHVMDYANQDPDGLLIWLDDRSSWVPNGVGDPAPSKEPAAQPNPRKSRDGYVYILRSQDGYYKIGKSIVPKVRIRSMGVVLPFAIEPIHLIPSNDYSRAERSLHDKFGDQRVRGEWFALTEGDVEWLLSLNRLFY
jgi:hypothetical protein